MAVGGEFGVHRGTIKRIDTVKGLGYIECAETFGAYSCDVVFDRNQLGEFEVGDQVCFSVALNGDGKPRACYLGDGGPGGGAGGSGSSGGSTAPEEEAEEEDTSEMFAAALAVATAPPTPAAAMLDLRRTVGILEAEVISEVPATSELLDMELTDGALAAAAAKTEVPLPLVSAASESEFASPALTACDDPAVVQVDEEFQGVISNWDDEGDRGLIQCSKTFSRYGVDVCLTRAHLGDFGVGDQLLFSVELSPEGQPEARALRSVDDLIARIEANEEEEPLDRQSSTENAAIDDWRERGFRGTIKCFDADRGFGFIRCTETYRRYRADVFVHQRQLSNFTEGDQVCFYVREGKRGRPKATVLWSPEDDDDYGDFGTRPDSDQFPVQTGIVKKVDFEKGFGFIACPELWERYRKDLFASGKELAGRAVGDAVRFVVKEDARGRPQAVNVRPEVKSLGQEYFGTIKLIDEEKGFGFIRCPESYERYRSDIFVDESDLGSLEVGDQVNFHVRPDARGRPRGVDLVALASSETSSPEVAQDPLIGAQLVGTIKFFFDVDRGYGFISCPDTFETYQRDVFVYSTQVSGFKVGDQVTFTVRINNQGHPQAQDVKAAPKSNSWLSGEEAEPSSPALEEVFKGEVKSFSRKEGYGFIECAALKERYGRDVFVHQSQFLGIKVGDRVSFRVHVKKGQPQARYVNLEKHAAVAARSPASRRALAELEGLDPAALNKKLLRACASARPESVRDVDLLLEAGADPNARDVTGQLALMVSALNVRHGEQKCRLLLGAGASLDIDSSGGTGLVRWARERINPKFASFLDGLWRGEPVDCAMELDKPPGDEF